jgi:outer membrane protein
MRNRRSVAVLFCALGVVLHAIPAAAQDRVISLEEAQRLALANFETVRGARERIEQARAGRVQAASLSKPSVAASGVLTKNFITGEFNFSGYTIRVLPPYDYNLALAVSQPLFTGFRHQRMREQAEVGVDVAHRAFAITAQDGLLEVTRAYYHVLAARENMEISQRAVEVSREALRSAESLYNAGETVETSVLRARVAVMEARRQLLESENAAELANEQLALLTGVPGGFHVVRPPRPAFSGGPLNDLIDQALDNRSEVKALSLQRRIAELEIARRQGQYLPSITADAVYLQRRASFPSSQLSSVSVNATWLLFNGGRTAAEIASARSELHQIELQQELLRKQTALQVRATYMTVETLNASVDMLTAQVELARRNAESTFRAYRVGEATDLDLLEANATMTRSERQLAVTTFNREIAMYELQRAVGTFAIDVLPAAAGGSQ